MARMVINRYGSLGALGLLWLLAISLLWCPTLANASETLPLRVRKVIVQAQQLMEQQQYTDALAVLDVVEQQPEYSGAWLNVAQCYYVLERYIEAAEAFEQSYQLITPLRSQLRYNAALAYLQGEKPAAAVSLLKQLVIDFPDQNSVPWRAALVQGYNGLDQSQLALPHLEFLADATTGDDQRRWRELLVQHYLVLKMVDEALLAVDNYTKIDGLEPLWWKLLTSIHLDAGRYSKGLVALKVLAYLQPLTDQEQHLLADLYLTLGVPQEAVRYYETLQQQRPYDEQLLTRLAHASLNLHQPEDALFWLQQAQGDSVDVKLLMLQGQLLFS
ncbi:MAG: tetratricopeptide repeat protein, partial [Deltaproteobacteria bacterium]|nr:tetratricopeptide repeat protein [Deltaproteobacteria bacterium]